MLYGRQRFLASDNLRDILLYVTKYGLEHITTGDIFIEAMNSGIISETDGNNICSNMVRKKRMLPALTFTDYLRSKQL